MSAADLLQEWRRLGDEQALERFEQLVLSQKPAEQPWTPVTDYSFEARKPLERPHAELIARTFSIEMQPALDYGCGFGHLVSLLRYYEVDACGYDPHLPDRALMQPTARHNCTNELWTLHARQPFPLVICREVLEHLTIRELRQTVTSLCKLSARFVYVTTRFAQNPTHLLDVDTSDDLDPTHITMLNQSFLRVLFVLEGFKRRADLEEKLDHMKKGRCLVYERA